MGSVHGNITAIGPDTQPFNVAGVPLKLSGTFAAPTSVSVFSSEQGEYSFIDLLPGEYTLEASLQGFKKYTKSVTIQAGQVILEDIRLELEALSEQVTVSADRDDLKATQAAPAQNSSKHASDGPTGERCFQNALL
jgi:hypothetical protein